MYSVPGVGTYVNCMMRMSHLPELSWSFPVTSIALFSPTCSVTNNTNQLPYTRCVRAVRDVSFDTAKWHSESTALSTHIGVLPLFIVCLFPFSVNLYFLLIIASALSNTPSREHTTHATMALPRFLPFASSTTPLQAATYLLGISLFSISFLVFLNSSVSFVITDLIGVKDGVGDIVGTLGFVDELVALVACPAWGLVSDRLGVRWVAVMGYTVIGLSLFLFVQSRNVYPQLLLARVLFAVGATAA